MRSTMCRAWRRCYTSSSSKKKYDAFLITNNAQYMEHLYKLWLQDNNAVDKSWDVYFRNLDNVSTPTPVPRSFKVESPVTDVPTHLMTKTEVDIKAIPNVRMKSHGGSNTAIDDEYALKTLAVNATIRAYQARGHLVADTDPLGITNPDAAGLKNTANLPHKVVVREHLNLMADSDYDREFFMGTITRLGGDKPSLTLKEIIKRLNNTYCGHIGIEYSYIHDPQVLDWIRNKFETPGATKLTEEHRKWIWRNIMRAVTFESFLAKKYGPEKRFGLEGCDAFIPSVKQLLETAADKGVETAAIGMAHRGRLNTLINVCQKPLHQLLTQFKPVAIDGLESGDVKYHLGTCMDKVTYSGKKIHVAIMPNPSHLEAVDPVVVGRIRAEQVARNDHAQGTKSMAILVHGDASFSGQGVCYESMHLSKLPEYTTGGVVHSVINNQIGFTTDPRYSRGSHHCTDLARMVNAPIFHVHADDPDAVVYCSKVAMEYRCEYHNDVVMDIVGYRRNGHNEMDEPMLTQPLMYKVIQNHPNVLQIYTDKLLKEGLIDEAYVKQQTEKYLDTCESEFQKAQGITMMQMADWHDVPFTEFFANQSPDKPIPPTGITQEVIDTICTHVSSVPKDIKVHNVVKRLLERRANLKNERKFDWGMAECLAFASLCQEGHHVRLSGEDVERGTFSHRLHIIHDQDRDLTWVNHLNNIFPGQALYVVSNSPVSEFSVIGFELGYAAYDHNSLILWEAQFGDFANNCQVIIDNFLSSSQSKWGRQIGLVLLMPHGMEGQGPEHSSARLERFLKLSDDDVGDYEVNEEPEKAMTKQLFFVNWIVCNPTTPANMVHVLRRQMLMPFRKPLVIMTPKSLLRHPQAQSTFDEIGPGTQFTPLYPDATVKEDKVSKVLLCSGKVFYELVEERKANKLEESVAIIRIEQITPFPYHLLIKEVSKYPKSKITWVQEEHKNFGAFTYVRDRIAHALKIPIDEVHYAGRPPASSPATGSKVLFKNEYKDMIKAAFELN